MMKQNPKKYFFNQTTKKNKHCQGRFLMIIFVSFLNDKNTKKKVFIEFMVYNIPFEFPEFIEMAKKSMNHSPIKHSFLRTQSFLCANFFFSIELSKSGYLSSTSIYAKAK